MNRNTRSSGSHCAVVGCSNNYRKRKELATQTCEGHLQPRSECGCGLFRFHRFPADEDRRRLWLASVNRKNFVPSPFSRVCSEHFISRGGSDTNPVPMVKLGYERKVKVARRRIVKREYVPVKRHKLCDSRAEGALPEASAAPADLPCGSDAGATSCAYADEAVPGHPRADRDESTDNSSMPLLHHWQHHWHHRRVLVSREAQATVPAFSLGTQCAAVRFVRSAASQTDGGGFPVLPDAESDGSSLDASFEVRCGNPAVQGGGDSAVGALEEQCSCAYGGTYTSCVRCSSFPLLLATSDEPGPCCCFLQLLLRSVPSDELTMDANDSGSELAVTSSSSNNQLTNRTASTSEDKAARRRARDKERKRRRRAADSSLREREAAAQRQRRANSRKIN